MTLADFLLVHLSSKNLILLVLYWLRVETNFRNAITKFLTQEKHTQIEPFYFVELDISGLNIEREQLEAGHSHGISGWISCRAHSHMTVPI